ncbi:zinc knuckle CX2CX4HX4C containing protein [Tanacetum coccineum]
MAGVDVNTLTMEQYLALSRENQAPGVVKPEIGGNVNFEIKTAKRWVDRLAPGTINTWDLLKKAFIQRYCPPSMIAKQLEDIYNFKQEGDESLYQAWVWNIESSSSNDGLAALVNKLDNLGRDVKKLKEIVYAIQDGCKICKGNHLDKECPLNEEVKQVGEEVVTKIDNNEDCKTIFTNDGAPLYTPFYYSPEEIDQQAINHENEDVRISHRYFALLLNQLPSKEKDPGNFILPCSIGRLDFNNALADLGASISIMPFSMYKRLGIGKLETIKMNLELADNSKCILKGIVRDLLIKIYKFILPIDFIILYVLEGFRMPIILGRPLLTTAHAKTDVFKKSISLEVGNEKVIFKLRNNLHDMKSESILMIQSNIIAEEDELMNIESDLFTYNTNTCESCHILAVDTDLFTYEIVTHETCDEISHKCCLNTQDVIGEKARTILGKKKPHWCALIYRQNNRIREVWASCNPSNEECDGGSLRNNAIRCYSESENDNDRVSIEWNDLFLNDWLKIKCAEVDEMMKKKILTEHWRKQFGVDYDDNNDFYDPEWCGESRNNEIRERVINNLHDEWFKGTFDDEDDIEGIIDYLEPTSYDGFIDLDEEEYNKR